MTTAPSPIGALLHRRVHVGVAWGAGVQYHTGQLIDVRWDTNGDVVYYVLDGERVLFGRYVCSLAPA